MHGTRAGCGEAVVVDAGPGAIYTAVVLSRLAMRRGEYGYDAPYALVIFGSLAVLSGVGAAIVWWRTPGRAAAPITLYFVFFLVNAASFFYTTRRGKFIEWDRILDRSHLRGDEMVLDMGCGRGAVLTAVARRLTTGRVTGVDIWSINGPVGQRDGRHPAQRVAGRGQRSRAHRDCRHASAPVSGRVLSIWWSRASRYTTSDRMPIGSGRSAKGSGS